MAVPILNKSKSWMRNLTIELNPNSILKEKVHQIPPIPPLGIVKIPLKFELSGFSESFIAVELILKDSEQEELSRIPIKLNRKSHTEPLKRTFLSKMDGSVQYYGVRFPEPYDTKQQYGVIFSHMGREWKQSIWRVNIPAKNGRL